MESWPRGIRIQAFSMSLKHLDGYQVPRSSTGTAAAASSTQSKTMISPLLRDLTQLFQTHGFIILQPYLTGLSSSAGTKQSINTYSIDEEEAKIRRKPNTWDSYSSQARFQQMPSDPSPSYYKQHHFL